MPLEEELRDLRRLNPSERIRRLRELEEQKKREIEEAEVMLKESEKEAQADEEERTSLPVPHMKAMSPESIETIEAKLLWAAKRGVSLQQKEEEVAVPAAKAHLSLSEAVEAERAASQQVSSVQYGEQLAESVRRQSGAAVVEAYAGQKASSAGEAYESITKQRGVEQTYQKPEARTEITYEARSATPGHEAQSHEAQQAQTQKQPQDFYTTASKEKKKRTAGY
ncbi:hypothetical protein HYV82_01790 [Candidatus Woesearchaeota archaeon]|nr:hypothetical protein [Candidatus Woesearchaeota archaeon]